MSIHFDQTMDQLLHADVHVELAALGVAVLLALFFAWSIRRTQALHAQVQTVSLWRGILFPLLSCVFLLLAKRLLMQWGTFHYFLLPTAAAGFFALAVVRFVRRVLVDSFPDAAWVRRLGRVMSALVWMWALLFILDAVKDFSTLLDSATFELGSHKVSVGNLLAGVIYAVFALVLALWVSSTLDKRVYQRRINDTSLQKIASSMTRALAIVLGVMVAFSAVGVDLTAFSVIGGAIGLGLGFGLQKLASNYVSGFVILFERSVRIGDHVCINDFEGVVTDIKTRYIQLQTSAGREAIIPNEKLITERVENLSRVRERSMQTIVVHVAYGSDLAQVEGAMLAVAKAHPLVDQARPPRVLLLHWDVHALSLQLNYWVCSGTSDAAGVRSDINKALLLRLTELSIAIAGRPAKVDVTMLSGLPPAPSGVSTAI